MPTSRPNWTIPFLRLRKEGIRGDALLWISGPCLVEDAECATTASSSFHTTAAQRSLQESANERPSSGNTRETNSCGSCCHIHQVSVRRRRVAYDEGILRSLSSRISPRSHLIYPLRFLRDEAVLCCRTDLGFGWPRRANRPGSEELRDPTSRWQVLLLIRTRLVERGASPKWDVGGDERGKNYFPFAARMGDFYHQWFLARSCDFYLPPSFRFLVLSLKCLVTNKKLLLFSCGNTISVIYKHYLIKRNGI
nr:PREDICTED: uncharacterized protein LOC108953340 [Musa acuminata subsp. malaccensis]